jgi:hypothetical protein
MHDDGGANLRDRQLFVQQLCVHERSSAEQLGRELRVQACHGCRCLLRHWQLVRRGRCLFAAAE